MDTIKLMKYYRRSIFFMLTGFLAAGFLKLPAFGINVAAKTDMKAPKGVLANGVGDKVVLSWEPVAGADGYEIYEKAEKQKKKTSSSKKKKNTDGNSDKKSAEDNSKNKENGKQADAGEENGASVKDEQIKVRAAENNMASVHGDHPSAGKKGAGGDRKKSAAGKKSKYIKVCRTGKRAIVLEDRKRGTIYTYKVRAVKKGALKDKVSGFSRGAVTELPGEGSRTTLKNFLNTAMAPVGSTMYIWDGGWKSKWKNRGSDGAWIGLNRTWRAYADSRKSSFNYRKARYKYGCGLDCSGFVGWVTYNAMKAKSAKAGRGYVAKSTVMASQFAKRGWGIYRKAPKVKDYRAGDVMSTKGHVYIVIGQCKDGSVVLVHSSPPGVQICGTHTRSGKKNSQAVRLAKKYRKKYFSSWQKRFKKCDRPAEYLKEYNQFRWDLSKGNVMSDPDGYRNMTPEQILKDLLKGR